MNQISDTIPWLKKMEPEPVVVTGSDLDLMMLVRLIRRRTGVILGVMAILCGVALPFLLAMTPVYRTEARFLVAPVMSVETGLPPDTFVMADEVERLRARAVVARVVDRLNLATLPEFNPALAPATLTDTLRDRLWPAPPAEPPTEAEVTERALAAVYDRLTVWRQTDSILQLSFTSRDADLAAAVPNAIIASYVDEVTAHRDARLQEALTQLRLRLTDQQARVAAARSDIANLRREQGTLAGGQPATADQTQLVLLNQQLADLQTRKAELLTTVATVDAALNDDGPAPLNETAILSQLRRSLETQQRDLNRLTTQFGEAYGGVQSQRAQVAELQEAIRRELTGWGASMRSQISHIAQEEATIQQMRNTALGQLSEVSANDLDMANLVRRAEAQTTALDAVDAQVRLLEAALDRPALTVDVLTPAAVPLRPQGKGRVFYGLILLAGSAVLGLIVAGVMDLTDRSVRHPQQLLRTGAALPVGLVPDAPWPGRRTGRIATDPRLTFAADKLLRAITGAAGSTFPASLMITASRAGEGRHYVAAALGQALATVGRQALIVDTRPAPRTGLMRRRDRRPGLTDFLRGHRDLDGAMYHDRTTGHRLMSLGTGPLPKLPDVGALESLLKQAAARGLIVVLIAPPAFENETAVRLAAVVQRVLLVVGWGRTPRDIIAQTLDDLRVPQTAPVLTVLNRVRIGRYALYAGPDGAAQVRTAYR